MKLLSLLTAAVPEPAKAVPARELPQNGLFASLLSLLRPEESEAGQEGASDDSGAGIEARLAEAETALSDPELDDAELAEIVAPLIADLAGMLAEAPTELSRLRAALPEDASPDLLASDAAEPDWRALADAVPGLAQLFAGEEGDMPVPPVDAERADPGAALQALVTRVVSEAVALSRPEAPVPGMLSAVLAQGAAGSLRQSRGADRGVPVEAMPETTADVAPVPDRAPQPVPVEGEAELALVAAADDPSENTTPEPRRAAAGQGLPTLPARPQTPEVPFVAPSNLGLTAVRTVAETGMAQGGGPAEAVSVSAGEPLRAYRITVAAQQSAFDALPPDPDPKTGLLQAVRSEGAEMGADADGTPQLIPRRAELGLGTPAFAAASQAAGVPAEPQNTAPVPAQAAAEAVVVAAPVVAGALTEASGSSVPPVAVAMTTPLGGVVAPRPAEALRPAAPAPAPGGAEPIFGQIRARLGDEGQIRVALKPEGLGQLEIEIGPDDSGHLRVAVRAEQSSVLSLLRADREGLLTVLRDAGHQVEARGLSFSDLGARDSGQGQTPGQGGSRAGAGPLPGSERASEAAEPDPEPRLVRRPPAGGVDIQV
ncbi:flagellar hook-length control protein FliK [Salipiger sp. P9]|nr:flagellar hook-length control protein FliK [Salipiger pentaromativorans]